MSELTTKEHIFEVSKKVFNQLGIAQTTMNILADESGLARRTIYRYFESKEDIAYKVMLVYMEGWNIAQKDMYGGLEGNGLEKLEQQLNRLLDYMIEHIVIMKFMSDFDNYFRDTVDYQLDEQMDEVVDSSFHHSDILFENILNEGMLDGSIKTNEGLNILVKTITNVLWVFGQAIALRGEHIEKDAGVDGIEMFRCQIRLYVQGLRGA